MKRFLYYFISLMITGAAAFVGCTYNEMTSPYGELNIIFDTEKVVLNAGESIELPLDRKSVV